MPLRPIEEFVGEHRFLSNFWSVPGGVTLRSHALAGQEQLVFPTVEHAYVAAKSLDPEERRTAADMPTAGSAKRYGARIELRPDWDSVKAPVMASLVTQKFEAGTMLAGLLIATGDAAIIEGNDRCDVYWGVCRCPEHLAAGDPVGGTGSNLLGSMLMARRTALSTQAATQSQPGDPAD